MSRFPKHHPGHYFTLPPRWAWIAWLVWAGSGIVVAVGLLLEGREACLPLAVLLGMGALLCAFDYLCFRSAKVRPDDSSAPPADHNSHNKRK